MAGICNDRYIRNNPDDGRKTSCQAVPGKAFVACAEAPFYLVPMYVRGAIICSSGRNNW